MIVITAIHLISHLFNETHQISGDYLEKMNVHMLTSIGFETLLKFERTLHSIFFLP